jgi:hypothetical protein
MVFYTTDADAAQGARMKIAADGKVAIGYTGTRYNTLSVQGHSQIFSGSLLLDTGMSVSHSSAEYLIMPRDGNGNMVFKTASADRMTINADGDVSPHTTEAQDLGASGKEWDNIFLQNSATVSDERRKEQIEDSPLGLDFVNQLRPVKYKRKNWIQKIEVAPAVEAAEGIEASDAVYEDMEMEYQRKHYGLVAQEVKGVLDAMEIDTQDFGGYVDANIKDGVDKLYLRYDEFISPLIKAVQELSAKVEALENA